MEPVVKHLIDFLTNDLMTGWWYLVCSLFDWHCIFSLNLVLDYVSSAKLIFTCKNVGEVVE
ncbi:hypothetical protein G9A89_022290 [Geosiphon pyriformis]|nr:hypothetical protein G9A89_022290 [Geosiphon pyriformis]